MRKCFVNVKYYDLPVQQNSSRGRSRNTDILGENFPSYGFGFITYQLCHFANSASQTLNPTSCGCYTDSVRTHINVFHKWSHGNQSLV